LATGLLIAVIGAKIISFVYTRWTNKDLAFSAHPIAVQRLKIKQTVFSKLFRKVTRMQRRLYGF